MKGGLFCRQPASCVHSTACPGSERGEKSGLEGQPRHLGQDPCHPSDLGIAAQPVTHHGGCSEAGLAAPLPALGASRQGSSLLQAQPRARATKEPEP